MQITPLKLSRNNALKIAGIMSAALLSFAVPQKIQSQSVKADTYISAESLVTPRGVSYDSLSITYPSPLIKIAGEYVNASVIVDLNKNILYKYDKDGTPECAYLVASGKKSMPTHACVKRVTHIESYPYKNAPDASKRKKYPWDYGPRVICMVIIDPETGEVAGINGEFIHGNNNPLSIGKYASKGCVRMDNEAVKELASQIKSGDYIVYMR